MHINIRSLYSKIDEFTALLSLLEYSFDVICVSETWLNPSTLRMVEIDIMTSIVQCELTGEGEMWEYMFVNLAIIQFLVTFPFSLPYLEMYIC